MKKTKTLASHVTPPSPTDPTAELPQSPPQPESKPPLPDWATKTPMQCFGYWIAMENDSNYEEVIEITRDEYVLLKQHLSKLRGY